MNIVERLKRLFRKKEEISEEAWKEFQIRVQNTIEEQREKFLQEQKENKGKETE